MSGLIPFTYDGREVRVRTDNAGEPLFCVADVCEVLGHTNPTQAITDAGIEEDDLSLAEVIDSLGRQQRARFVTEAGLYALTFSSRKPEAKPFKRWVTHEVLPALRKTGTYSTSKAKADTTAKDARLAEAERRRTGDAMLRAAKLTKDMDMLKATALRVIDMLGSPYARRNQAATIEAPPPRWFASEQIGEETSLNATLVGRISGIIGTRRELPGLVRLAQQPIEGGRMVDCWQYAGRAAEALSLACRAYKSGKYVGLAELAEDAALRFNARPD